MAQNDYVDGFGVVDADGLKIRTVSDTRRAAIVNYLCTDRGRMILRDASDASIELIWDNERRGATVMPVRCYVQP